MKKIMFVAALFMMTTNATASEWKLPQKSVLNDSNAALQFPEELNYFLKGGIDINSVIGAVIAKTIDPRGYHGSAYSNGKRPKLNYKLGNMGTGKCYSDLKSNGIFCP